MDAELSARARRVYDYVNELVTQALDMQGAAARMVESADSDKPFLLQVSAAHVLTHLRVLDERLRLKIFHEVAAIGAVLAEGTDAGQALDDLSALVQDGLAATDPLMHLRRAVAEELIDYFEAGHFTVQRRFDEQQMADIWGLRRLPKDPDDGYPTD